MEDLTDVYNELIMEHSMNSYNKKKLENADYCEVGHNPNCGDEIKLELKLNGDKIEKMAFTGHGCAISQASTSIMIDTLKGLGWNFIIVSVSTSVSVIVITSLSVVRWHDAKPLIKQIAMQVTNPNKYVISLSNI